MTANELTKSLLLGVSERFHGTVVLWRNNRIDAMAAGRGGSLRRVQAGIDGQADLSGIMPDGRRLEVEVKIGRDRQSPAQIAFERMIEAHGGVYIVARDMTALDVIETRIREKL